jgi:hypothetical protein
MKRLNLIEVPGHVALLALGHPWMTDEHLADLWTACTLGMDLSDEDEAIKQLSITGRDLLINKSTDYQTMKHVIGTVIQWVSTQPNRRIHDAVTRRLKELNEQERIS